MSQLCQLMDFRYGDFASMEDWAFNNADDHTLIRDAIQVILPSVNVMIWGLVPVNWQDWDSFALRHQQAHNEINAILGVGGVDLMKVDFKDRKQAEEWHAAHFREHQAWHELTLGIGGIWQ